jgi:hypothetical protein
MKTVTMYEAEDGKQFRFPDQCLEYEQQCTDLAAANDMLENGATLMAALTRAHQTRPWWDNGLTLEDKAVLMQVTKDTGFVIRHWQGRDDPAYKPCRLNHDCKVWLWSDAESWHYSYGDWVNLPNLMRYARDAAREHTQPLESA